MIARPVAAAVLCLALAACASHHPPALTLAGATPVPVPAAPPRPVCPPFRPWTDADRTALAAELAPVPEQSLTMRMALDWDRYYRAANACHGAQHK